MYIKASKQASFARRRGNRQPGSSLVLSETGKGLAFWVTVVLVGLGKGREGGGPGHGLLLLCCVCIIFFHLLSKLWTCLSRDPTILPWKEHPFPKYGKILSSHRPHPSPPLPQKISEDQLSPGFAGWMTRLLPIRKKYGVWRAYPSQKLEHFFFFNDTFHRQLTNNSTKVSFISCIWVWFLGCVDLSSKSSK